MCWKITFVIDDGYAWHKHECIVKAETETHAKELFLKFFSNILRNGDCIIQSKTKIEMLNVVDGIVYQNYRKLN